MLTGRYLRCLVASRSIRRVGRSHWQHEGAGTSVISVITGDAAAWRTRTSFDDFLHGEDTTT